MSHAPERTEKNCLNCGTTVIGHFCHICGQENIVPKESFGSLVLHFLYDITHFDSKFFDSLKYLLFRPGFLSAEYIRGRRASYLNPVRMYVFTSAIFFLIFFLITDPSDWFHTNENDPISPQRRTALISQFEKEYQKKQADSTFMLQTIQLLKDTATVTNGDIARLENRNKYKSFAEYDSVQNTLPREKRDNWIVRKAKQKFSAYGSDSKGQTKALLALAIDFMHRLPYLLFLSLPLFAFILKLLYIRRKQYYYADHAIFSIHHYIFSFILLLACILLGNLFNVTNWEVFRYGLIALLFVWPIHLYIAMLNFYKQRWFKTFIKFLLLNLLGFITLLILFLVFLFIAFMEFK